MLLDWSESKYNQWWLRKSLKVISGVLIALALIGPIFLQIQIGAMYFTVVDLLLFAMGLILWSIFYKMETYVRRNSPEHIILV